MKHSPTLLNYIHLANNTAKSLIPFHLMNLEYLINIQMLPGKPIVSPAWRRQGLLTAFLHQREGLAEEILALVVWVATHWSLPEELKT